MQSALESKTPGAETRRRTIVFKPSKRVSAPPSDSIIILGIMLVVLHAMPIGIG
jgi:hypothetical protein